MSSQATFDSSESVSGKDGSELTDGQIREHYQRLRPVFRELGDSCGLRTLGVADLKRWYLSEKTAEDSHSRGGEWTHRRRPTGLHGDADALSEKLERTYYAVLNYQSQAAIQDTYRRARFETGEDGNTTVWENGEHPLPDYPDVQALALFADIDIKDEYKQRPLSTRKRSQFEEIIERHIDVMADLIGTRDHVYALDSVGGAYVFTSPQITAPIGEHVDGRERGRVFSGIADRSRNWLGERFDAIHTELETSDWAKTDTQISRSRQYKGPLSIHASIDGVVTPINPNNVEYTFTPFNDVDEQLIAETLDWCEKFTAPIEGTEALDTLMAELFEDHYPTTPPNPETFDEHTKVVMSEMVMGEGEIFDQRCEQLQEAIELARDQGFVQRAEVIHRLYNTDQAGYTDPDAWYGLVIAEPVQELEERTGMVECDTGIRWPASISESETLGDHAKQVSREMMIDDYTPQRLERLCDKFCRVVEFIQNRGEATRKDLIEQFYDSEDGYASPNTWHQQLIARNIHELEDRTSAIEHDHAAGVYRCPGEISEPETFDESVQWVKEKEIPGDGARLERRREQFAAAIERVCESGVSTRPETIAACCPDDNGGYATPAGWYQRVIRKPMLALEEYTDEIEVIAGEIRYPANIEPEPVPETFAGHVGRVAEADVPGEGELCERRREQFRAAIGFVQEHGAASKDEIIAECCPEDNAGYVNSNKWYGGVVRKPARTLAERTEEIEVGAGEIRFPESLLTPPQTPKTLEDHALSIAEEEIPGSGLLFQRRQRAFLDVLQYIKDEGSADRKELAETFYQADNDLGYSSADSWRVRIVTTPFRALEERTSVINRVTGTIHYTK